MSTVKVRTDKKPERTFIWRFNRKVDARTFEQFQLNAVMGGMSPTEALMKFIRGFNADNARQFAAVGETEMLEHLRRLKFKSTRQWLKGFRDRGDLVKGEDWFTDGKAVVYNRDAVVKFVRSRMNGRSRA
jgi:hypothetical protein